MARLLLEDITLTRQDHLALHVRFRGGAHRTIRLPLPQRSWERRQTSQEVVAAIDRLLNNHTYPEIATILNNQGLESGEGLPFTARIVARIQRSYQLTSRYDRLRKSGLLTVEEMAKVLGIQPTCECEPFYRGASEPLEGSACIVDFPRLAQSAQDLRMHGRARSAAGRPRNVCLARALPEEPLGHHRAPAVGHADEEHVADLVIVATAK